MGEDLKKKIIEDFGLFKLGASEQELMIEKIGNLLFESVVEKAVDGMDDGNMREFDHLLTEEGVNPIKIVEFLRAKSTGFESIVVDEMARLKRATSGIFA